MDNDALDSVDQFEGPVIAGLDCLRRLAPAPVQDGVGRGNPCRGRGVFRTHDADKDLERGSSVAARQRTNFGEGFWHSGIIRNASELEYFPADIFESQFGNMIRGPTSRFKKSDGLKIG